MDVRSTYIVLYPSQISTAQEFQRSVTLRFLRRKQTFTQSSTPIYPAIPDGQKAAAYSGLL